MWKYFLINAKTEFKPATNEERRILKSIRDLKIVAGDATAVGFLKHPVDGRTEKLLLYSTLGDLVLKFKSFSLKAEATTTVGCDMNTSNTETVRDF